MRPIFIHSKVDDAGLTPVQFRVLGRIARRDDGESGCWESVPEIAKACRIRVPTTRKALQDLVQLGFLTLQKRSGESWMYRLVPVDALPGPLLFEAPGTETEEVRKEHGDPSHSRPVHPSRKKPQHPSRSRPPKGIPTKESKEGNPVKEVQTPALPVPLTLTPTTTTALVEAERSDLEHTYLELAASLGISPRAMADTFEHRLAGIATRQRLTMKGVAIALAEWTRTKSEWFRANGTTRANAMSHFESWLTSRPGLRIVQAHYDHDRYDLGNDMRFGNPNRTPAPTAEDHLREGWGGEQG